MARWEKWSREDWSNARTGRMALAEVQAVHASGRCNRPVADVAGRAASLTVRSRTVAGA